MELRWHQIYDENGIYSNVELQYRECEEYPWEAVPYVRERDPEAKDEKE